MLRGFVGDLGRVPMDLQPASHQGRSKVIPPSLDHRGATFRPVKCFEEERHSEGISPRDFTPEK